MALIPLDEMTELKSAATVKTVAEGAEEDQQMLSVAHAINLAANTGCLCTRWQHPLLPAVKTALEAEGYVVTQITEGVVNPDIRWLISWG